MLNHNPKSSAGEHEYAISATEAECLRRCQEGDRNAFHEIILRYQDQIFTYVSAHIDNPQKTLDVTRDIFIAAYSNFSQFDGTCSLKAWLLSLAEVHVLQAKRKELSWPRRIIPFPRLRLLRAFKKSAPEPADTDGTSDCENVSELLSAYLDGETTELETKRIEKHLKRCAACRDEFDELQETLDLMQMFGPQRAPQELRSAIHDALERQPSLYSKILQGFPLRQRGLNVAIITLAIAMGVGIIYQQQQMQNLLVKLQKGSLVRGLEKIPSSSQAASQTFVIVTGKLFSQELPLKTGDFVEELITQRQLHSETTQTYFFEAEVPQLLTHLKKYLDTLHATIREDHFVWEETLSIWQLRVELPEDAVSQLSRFFQSLSSEPSSSVDAEEINATQIQIFILDRANL